jgi:hypothetical protein
MKITSNTVLGLDLCFVFVVCNIGSCAVGVITAPTKTIEVTRIIPVVNQITPTHLVYATRTARVEPMTPRPIVEIPTKHKYETEIPTLSSAPSVGMVGNRSESAGIALTVMDVYKTNKINEYLSLDAGNIYLVLEVVIENIGRNDEIPYNPFYFSVKDSNGFEYNVSMLAPEPSLKSGTLVRGDLAHGFIAFEVREVAECFIVTYMPIVLFGGYSPIRINLGQ